MSRWLDFVEMPAVNVSGTTRTWDVFSKARDLKLGEIRWYGRWRQYAFFPNAGTLFNTECLRDIAQFIYDHRSDRRATV